MQVNFEPAAVNRGESITRRFEVLFLDERVRVVQFLPEEEDKDPVLFVFERVAEEDTEEQEVEVWRQIDCASFGCMLLCGAPYYEMGASCRETRRYQLTSPKGEALAGRLSKTTPGSKHRAPPAGRWKS